jgi:hypothetical protein
MGLVKTLHISRFVDKADDLAPWDRYLANEVQHSVNTINWPTFPYQPLVTFAAGYNGTGLFVRFAVEEAAIRAEHTAPNTAVCQDSCVEFFIAPFSKAYLNFEFNCIGTTLVSRGTSRADLACLPTDQVCRIRTLASLGTEPIPLRETPTRWTLTAAIPLDLLGWHAEDIPGHICRGNIYKCGDLLPTPHYLTWNAVTAAKPDFHRPECFGRILFDSPR